MVSTSTRVASSRTAWSRLSSKALGLFIPSIVWAVICLLSSAIVCESSFTRFTSWAMETFMSVWMDLMASMLVENMSARLSEKEIRLSRLAVESGRRARSCQALKKLFSEELMPWRLDSLKMFSSEAMMVSCWSQRDELVDCLT